MTKSTTASKGQAAEDGTLIFGKSPGSWGFIIFALLALGAILYW